MIRKTAREELQEIIDKNKIKIQEIKDQYPWKKERFNQIEKELKELLLLIKKTRFETIKEAIEFAKKHKLNRFGEFYIRPDFTGSELYVIHFAIFGTPSPWVIK